MAALVLFLAMLAMANSCSGATWCVCRNELGDAALQKSLDYACGAGADCSPLLQNGVCYNPNTVKAHCSYAVNSYFQRKGQAQGTCDFAGTATTVATDPSPSSTCSFPSSASSSGTTPGTSPPSTTTPGTSPPGTTTPGTSPPGTTTPPSTTIPGTSPPTTTTPGLSPPTTTSPGLSPPGIIGGTTGTSLGPTGLNNDASGVFHPKAELGPFLLSLFFSCLVVLRG